MSLLGNGSSAAGVVRAINLTYRTAFAAVFGIMSWLAAQQFSAIADGIEAAGRDAKEAKAAAIATGDTLDARAAEIKAELAKLTAENHGQENRLDRLERRLDGNDGRGR